jgi:hypothetical protein
MSNAMTRVSAAAAAGSKDDWENAGVVTDTANIMSRKPKSSGQSNCRPHL